MPFKKKCDNVVVFGHKKSPAQTGLDFGMKKFSFS
jgi:hypothetical protein